MGQAIRSVLDALIVAMANSPESAYGLLTFCFLYMLLSTVVLLRDRQTMPIVVIAAPLILLVSALVVEAAT